MTRIAAVLLFVAFCGADIVRGQSYGTAALDLTGQTADKAAELGTSVVRLAYTWDIIEPVRKGQFNWVLADGWRDQARRTNRSIFGLLAYTPRWANGDHHYNYPPLNYQDWYDFVYAVADRYRDDIFLWGIWNEPNLGGYLLDGDLHAYQSLATTARAAIRAANPAALVLGPEVSWHAVRDGWYQAAMHSFGDAFDIVSVHWYADGPDLGLMMDEWVRPFAMGKPVWLSEVGTRPCGTIYGETGQALFYLKVLREFVLRRDWWTTVVFYNLHENETRSDCGWAITRDNWSDRPAFSLYKNFIAANP